VSQSKKYDDQNDDALNLYDDDVELEEFFDSMVQRSFNRRRNRRFRTKQYLDDLEEKRWLRRQLDDWDSESIH
jgi:hypothetical protein